MKFETDIDTLEHGHRFNNIKNKINIYFIDGTCIGKDRMRRFHRGLNIARQFFDSQRVRIVNEAYVWDKMPAGAVVFDKITAERLMQFITEYRKAIGNSGTTDILIYGDMLDWDEVKYWCNGIITSNRDDVIDFTGFVECGLLDDTLPGFRFMMREWHREINVYSLLLNSKHSAYRIPNTRAVHYTISVGTFLCGQGESSARPSVEFDEQIGIHVARAAALDDAKKQIGSITTFVETIRGKLEPLVRQYALYNTADLTLKITR